MCQFLGLINNRSSTSLCLEALKITKKTIIPIYCNVAEFLAGNTALWTEFVLRNMGLSSPNINRFFVESTKDMPDMTYRLFLISFMAI